MSEHDLQCAVAEYLDLMGYLWAAIPNGGHRHKAVAAKLKREGAKAGVPDILIFEDWAEYLSVMGGEMTLHGHGIAIELKFGKNKPRPNQVEWLDALEKRGWLTQVCYSLDEAVRVCEHIRK